MIQNEKTFTTKLGEAIAKLFPYYSDIQYELAEPFTKYRFTTGEINEVVELNDAKIYEEIAANLYIELLKNPNTIFNIYRTGSPKPYYDIRVGTLSESKAILGILREAGITWADEQTNPLTEHYFDKYGDKTIYRVISHWGGSTDKNQITAGSADWVESNFNSYNFSQQLAEGLHIEGTRQSKRKKRGQ